MGGWKIVPSIKTSQRTTALSTTMDSVELNQFFESGLLSDTIVRVQFASEPKHDKIDIPVHSIVLASSSQKFKLLLTDPQWVKKEGDKYLINIILDSPDQLDVFKAVLAHCNTGSLATPESYGSDAELRLFWTKCAQLADQQGVDKVVVAALNQVFFANGNKEVVPWEAVELALKEPIRHTFVKDSRVWDIVLFNVNKTDDKTDKTDAALEMIVDVFGDLGVLEQKWRDVPLTNVNIIKDMTTDAFVAMINHPNTKASEDLVAMMVARKMLHQMLPEDDIVKLLELVRWEHVMPQVASHIKNQVEPVEKYFENKMEKRQKLVSLAQRTPSSVTEVVLSQHGLRRASEIVWSQNGGNCTAPLMRDCTAYFHGCRIHLRVKSDDKCITASLVVFGLVWNTNINIGLTGTAWIELFGDSRRWWSKQLDGNNDTISITWTEDEVISGAFAVKVAITGLK
jgi:hypothetical protein